MKSYLALPFASVLLFATAGQVSGQGLQPDSQWSAHARMQQNANESAQAETDMSYGNLGWSPNASGQFVKNASYGGVAATHGEMGGPANTQCSTGTRCDIFFGR
jgi:hypothetical protein